MKASLSFKDFRKSIKTLSEFFLGLAILNIGIVTYLAFYVGARFQYLNDQIPFFYSKIWGDAQLADKINIFTLPILATVLTVLGVIFAIYAKNRFMRYGELIVMLVTTFANIGIGLSALRIIRIASIPFDPLIDPVYTKLFIPFGLAFLIAYVFTPRFLEIAKRYNIITDPTLHQHPGMLLQKPSARGGGVVFTLAFVVASLFTVVITKEIAAIFFAAIMSATIGLLDDLANTNPKSKFRAFGSPRLRLFVLQPLSILFVIFAGVRINFIGVPFFETLQLNEYLFSVLGVAIAPISVLLTVIWIAWIINMLSFSNGIDGQYAGIVGIAFTVVALLSLRFIPLENTQLDLAKLAIIGAGAALGLAPYTWHPSRIMWGFGATAAGIVLATLSIISGTKIATSIIVLMIPFLDAVVTVSRRLLQMKSPIMGDRGHLHHLLLKNGWSIKGVAIFYWVSSAVLGGIALMSSEKGAALVALTLSGVVAFLIILLNLRSAKEPPQQQEPEITNPMVGGPAIEAHSEISS